jgi:hypothetical protein
LAWLGLAVLAGMRLWAGLADVAPEQAFIVSYGMAYLLPVGLTAIVAGILALRLLGSLDHWFWGVLAIACTALFAADAYFGWYVLYVDPKGPPIWDWFQGLHAVGVISFGLLIGTLTDVYRRPVAVRIRLFLDIVIAMAVAYPIVLIGWTQPAFASIEDGMRIAAWAAVYPVFGVAMLTTIVWVLAGEKAGRWRTCSPRG